ncbi:hypothetical protein ABZY93_27950 [Streptomyces smyrnaeus]|uniref:hypothetical protein n=1 Tax=Streptomyces smyrnaeus TaxID=1387713 RepID=UPI0033B1AFF9
MNDVMLPWPEPRRPGKAGAGQPQPAPHYEIQRVNADGSTGPVEVLPITRPPWAAKSGRRGFLGAGIASSVAAALLLSGCGDDDSKSPSSPSSPSSPPPSPSDSGSGSPSPTDSAPSPKPPPSTPPSSPTSPTYPTQPAPSDRYPDPVDPTYGTTGGTTVGGGSGGTICTCNKVCTCIPVCQAHELLHADPVVRRMAETVIVAMGTRELPYLRWAAQEAPGALRTRIEALIEELHAGRSLTPADLADPGCEPYLASGNPVIAMMAAQVLALRALRGAGLTGATAERAAQALTTGHALHLDRAPAWSR